MRKLQKALTKSIALSKGFAYWLSLFCGCGLRHRDDLSQPLDIIISTKLYLFLTSQPATHFLEGYLTHQTRGRQRLCLY